jgi:hypothetical protein
MPAEPRAPIPVSRHQLIVTTPRCIPLDPLANCGLIKVDENPFAELLDRGQPVRIVRKRGAAHRKPDILELAVGAGRGSLKSEAVWRLLGAEYFLAMYAGGLEKFGYRDSPLEKMAYEAQELFERSGSVFDAERFVEQRLSAL